MNVSVGNWKCVECSWNTAIWRDFKVWFFKKWDPNRFPFVVYDNKVDLEKRAVSPIQILRSSAIGNPNTPFKSKIPYFFTKLTNLMSCCICRAGTICKWWFCSLEFVVCVFDKSYFEISSNCSMSNLKLSWK